MSTVTSRSSYPSASAELRDWIREQSLAGHARDAMLLAMIESGWAPQVAARTLDEEWSAGGDADHPAPLKVSRDAWCPEPDLQDAPSRLWVHDREVQVVLSLGHPRVVVLGGFLSDEECDHLVAAAEPRLIRSETVNGDTGGSEVNEARTSRGMFFGRGESELIARVEARIAALVNWPVDRGEGIQVLHYGVGAEYRPHYDYFDPAQPGTPSILRRGGQRVGTLVMYLNTVERGGGTVFPDAQLEVAPLKGNAVFFSYPDADPASGSLHGGSPVRLGEKWVATKWLRERRFD